MLYGEMIFTFIQNFVILILFKVYSKNLSMVKFSSRLLILLIFAYILFGGIIPESFY